jgi:hypothetical protein
MVQPSKNENVWKHLIPRRMTRCGRRPIAGATFRDHRALELLESAERRFDFFGGNRIRTRVVFSGLLDFKSTVLDRFADRYWS